MRALVGFALCLLFASGSARAIEIHDVVSPGGIHAWLVENHGSKVISLQFAVRCGSACDPADKRGLSTYVTSLLDEGAGPYDSGAYQGRLADLSASVDFGASDDELTGSMQVLSPDRDEVFELLRLALAEPRFDEKAVTRIHAELDQLIEQQLEEPNALAHHLLFDAEFPDHPYSAWDTGSKASIAAITPDDLKKFVKTRFGRDQLLIAVVGDIVPDELGRLLDKTFGFLPDKASAAVPPANVSPAAASEVLLTKKPNPQSVVRFGQPGLAVHDPDLYALMIVNRALGGGGLSNRLSDEVREKRGLAYGISTTLVLMDHADLVGGGVATQNARLAETLDVVRHEWAKMREDGPTETELADAKTYLNGSYTIGLTSSAAIAGRLLTIQEENLGIDYFERRPKLIDAVTLADAKRVAKRVLDPSKLVFAVVGNPTGLTPDKTIEAAH